MIYFFSKLEVCSAERILHIHLCTMCSWIILHILDLAPASQQTHRPKKLKGGAAIVEGFLNGLALKLKKFQDFQVRFFKALQFFCIMTGCLEFLEKTNDLSKYSELRRNQNRTSVSKALQIRGAPWSTFLSSWYQNNWLLYRVSKQGLIIQGPQLKVDLDILFF